MAPFVLFHDTSGLGSPLTLTRKTAVSPGSGVHLQWQKSFLNFEFGVSGRMSDAHLPQQLPGLVYTGSLGCFGPQVCWLQTVWWRLQEVWISSSARLKQSWKYVGIYFQPKLDQSTNTDDKEEWKWLVCATSRGQSCHTIPVTRLKRGWTRHRL